MDKMERLACWKNIVGNTSSPPWTNEDDLYAYFQHFRPDGQGVEKVFVGVERGDEILARLLPFYHYTREGAEQDAYFVVRKPQVTTQAELFGIIKEYLEKVRQIAVAFGSRRLVSLVESVRIEIKRGKAPPHPPLPESRYALMYDIVSDWFGSLQPAPSDVSLLHEAFYSMTCSYELAHYIMWPIYREATPIEDPFAPNFQLWIRGAEYRFTADALTTYAPALAD